MPSGCASNSSRSTVLGAPSFFAGLMGDRAAGRDLHPEAHDRLVHRADLLDVEGAIGDAFAAEDEELLEHPVDRAVRDEGRPDALEILPDACIGRTGLQGTGTDPDRRWHRGAPAG